MGLNLTQKLIASHLRGGLASEPGTPLQLGIDQTLTQDATGTLVMLELEAIGLDRVQTELSAQYVDHNLLQTDSRNADDHLFLESACRRWGIWYSRPGNGVSHVVHMQRFGEPGKTLLGSDSHTCAAGSMGMLSIGAGGLDVAQAMAGEPYRLTMPRVIGIELVGELPRFVSAKDVILEVLRRLGVRGAVGAVLEYVGPGVANLSAMDRHVIANMGAETGATTSVFPSDEETRRYLCEQEREDAWRELTADDDATYDVIETIDLSTLEPLIATPSSPGNVVPVREVAGEDVYQAYVGSSANPGLRDLAVCAHMVRGRRVHEGVSFDINPASRQDLEALAASGDLGALIAAGARLHQAGCNGCIGMGQAPATGRNSLRTTPRNFPGRSGTREDSVYLCSPETATAAALTGVITDPRELGLAPAPPLPHASSRASTRTEMLAAPPPPSEAHDVELVKGPNITRVPDFDPIAESWSLPVIARLGDDISTDEILPAGARVLPFRSNVERISDFAFESTLPEYVQRAKDTREDGGHVLVAGENYGQGSSREHAALATRFLGLRVVIARSFARIHRKNLVNFGVLPLLFVGNGEIPDEGDTIRVEGLHDALENGQETFTLHNETRDEDVPVRHDLNEHELEKLLAGGVLRWLQSSGTARDA